MIEKLYGYVFGYNFINTTVFLFLLFATYSSCLQLSIYTQHARIIVSARRF
jgi:hypothetical protein